MCMPRNEPWESTGAIRSVAAPLLTSSEITTTFPGGQARLEDALGTMPSAAVTSTGAATRETTAVTPPV